MIRVLALDPSLTATGYAHPDHDPLDPQPVTGTITDNGLRGPARLAHITNQTLHLTTTTHAQLVAIEGYAFARPNQAHQIGELGGVLRTTLWARNTPYIEVPPKTIKKYATGKGNADKDAVLAAAIRRLGYAGHSHNEADALWLYAVICDAAGQPLADVPQAHRDALAPIEQDLAALHLTPTSNQER